MIWPNGLVEITVVIINPTSAGKTYIYIVNNKNNEMIIFNLLIFEKILSDIGHRASELVIIHLLPK